MINLFKYLFFIFLMIFFTSCKTSDEEPIQQKRNFEHFDETNFKEFSIESRNAQYLNYFMLPDCFEEDYWSSMNFFGNQAYYCQDLNLYFSIDFFYFSDIEYYESYLEFPSSENKPTPEIILNYLMELRLIGLQDAKGSVIVMDKTNSGDTLYLSSIYGKVQDYNQENNFYQFGYVPASNGFFLMQAMGRMTDIRYLYDDIVALFKTFV